MGRMYLASLVWIVESKGMLVRHDDHAEDSRFCRAVLLARLRLLVESHEDSTSRLARCCDRNRPVCCRNRLLDRDDVAIHPK